MKLFAITISVPFGIYSFVIIAQNETNAINMANADLAYVDFTNEEVIREIKLLPAIPTDNTEEIVYYAHYEE